ncbi:MAG: muconolactone Delta-isomerase family protein [Deltaproteobacteria bacterium]
MQYLVQLRLSSSARPRSQVDGINLIEKFIFPTLKQCKKLQEEKKILAGGTISGAISLALIMNAESAQELDKLILSLPIWPLMETQVTPLSTFDARMHSLLPRIEELRAQVREIESAPGGSR